MGGTWIRVSAVDRRGRRRGARQPSPGLDGLSDCLARLWRRWHVQRDDVESLVVASRGVWTGTERRHHARRLYGLARRVAVIADVEAAYLGALGDRAGILLLAGTGRWPSAATAGAMGAGRRLGPVARRRGSAFWIGRESLRASMSTTGFSRTRRILRSPDPVARIASLAPGAERGTGTGRRATHRGLSQDALANLVVEVARALRLLARPRELVGSAPLTRAFARESGARPASRRRGACLDTELSALAATFLLAERLARAPRKRTTPALSLKERESSEPSLWGEGR
jgi:hypothetical protein